MYLTALSEKYYYASQIVALQHIVKKHKAKL